MTTNITPAVSGTSAESFTTLSPEQLFDDITHLGQTEEWKKKITSYCLKNGAIPFIDYSDEFGGWVWHSLQIMGSELIYKKDISQKFEGKTGGH